MNRRKQDLPSRTPPELSAVDEGRCSISLDALLAGEPIEAARADALDLAQKKLSRLVLKEAVLCRLSFAGTGILSVRLRDVRLCNCDLSNAVFRGIEATRVEFIGCRLLGLKVIECHWQDVLVEGCDGRYAQFNDGHLRRCEFRSTQLMEADLRGSDIQGTIFSDVGLQRADVTGAKLDQADLRGADIDGLILRAGDARGAIITPVQAMDLARLLGVTIL